MKLHFSLMIDESVPTYLSPLYFPLYIYEAVLLLEYSAHFLSHVRYKCGTQNILFEFHTQ